MAIIIWVLMQWIGMQIALNTLIGELLLVAIPTIIGGGSYWGMVSN